MSTNRPVIIAIAVLLPLLGGGAYGVYYVMNQGTNAQQTNETAKKNASSAIPDLGWREYTPPSANDTPPDDGGEPTDDAGEDSGENGPENGPEEEIANTEREIDIWLNNLALATKAGDRKGIALYHEMLKKARPHELVDERVRNALGNEQSAWVRIQFFFAFHGEEAKFDWAMHVYDTRTAKFMGTDDLYAAGEIEELSHVVKLLYGHLRDDWEKEGSSDSRIVSLVRNALEREKPRWVLERTAWMFGSLLDEEASLAIAFKNELREYLLRRSAERGLREFAFSAYVLTYEPHTQVFSDLERNEWSDYASTLATLLPLRRKPGDLSPHSGMRVPHLEDLLDSDELPKLFERLLQGNMPVEEKRLLIQRIAEYAVPNGRAMIEAGLDRKDENYPDYLVAFGSFAADDADLQRLTRVADDPDVSTAQGAIEGLRRSGLAAADAELRKVLEQGTNIGVKSQALGALLSRAKKQTDLLEEYLDASKDASLRAVAVSHVDITDIKRLKQIVTDDASPRVRQAALTRLGGITPENSRVRKDLLGFFRMVSSRDSSPVIRKAADKYADDFQD